MAPRVLEIFRKPDENKENKGSGVIKVTPDPLSRRPLISSGTTISVNMHTRTWSGEVGFNGKQPARSCRPCAGECDRSWSHLDDRLQTVLHHLKKQHHGAWALDTERRKHPRFKAENPQIWAGRWLSPTEFETSASFVDNISLGGAR